MELLDHKSKNMQAVLVALANKEVRTYVEKNHVDTLKTDDVVVAMKFGRFGREESTLILITRGDNVHS
jgi:Bardet-Biedl syndrome 1 protein